MKVDVKAWVHVNLSEILPNLKREKKKRFGISLYKIDIWNYFRRFTSYTDKMFGNRLSVMVSLSKFIIALVSFTIIDKVAMFKQNN